MDDTKKTKKQLIAELSELRQSKESQNIVQTFLKTTDFLVYLVNPEGVILDINEAATKRFNTTLEDTIGTNVFDYFPPEVAKSRKDMAEKVINSKKPICFENQRGEMSFYTSVLPILNVQGNVAKMLVYVQDITDQKRVETALKESEANYYEIFNSVNDMIVVHDGKTGRPLEVNDKMIETFGWTHDEFLKLSVEDWSYGKPPYSQKEALMWIKKAAKGEPQLFEWMSKRKSGEIFWVEVNLKRAMIKGQDAVLAVVRDITERKETEEELQKTQRLESLGLLAGGIAHDFNNLLAGLFGFLELAREKIHNDLFALEDIDSAIQCFSRAKDLTQQLLTFAKGGTPDKAPLKIENILKESIKLSLSGSNIQCKTQLENDLYLIDVDHGQMNQVFNNILLNARQAMSNNGTIEITVKNREIKPQEIPDLSAGIYVDITFKDKGIGILPNHITQVFDPFFTTKQTGSGLGLATCYSIIKKHSGYISISSELGISTTVNVILPAITAELQEQINESDVALPKTGRILFMDDEEIIRNLVSKIMKMAMLDFECVKNGEEAIEAYKKSMNEGNIFTVVILDLTVMRGMGGEKTIRRLLDIDPNIKAIASSGYSDNPILTNPKEYGFAGKIIKPYKVNEFLKTLSDVTNYK